MLNRMRCILDPNLRTALGTPRAVEATSWAPRSLQGAWEGAEVLRERAVSFTVHGFGSPSPEMAVFLTVTKSPAESLGKGGGGDRVV